MFIYATYIFKTDAVGIVAQVASYSLGETFEQLVQTSTSVIIGLNTTSGCIPCRDQKVYFLNRENLLLLCVTDQELRLDQATAHLTNVYDVQSRSSGELLTQRIRESQNVYSDPGSTREGQLLMKLDGVKDTLFDNITGLIDRGRKLDMLEEEGTELQDMSKQMAKETPRLVREIKRKNYKLNFIIAVVFVVAFFSFCVIIMSLMVFLYLLVECKGISCLIEEFK